MLSIEMTMGGYSVTINGQPFGYIDKDGFFLDIRSRDKFLRISNLDLMTLAKEVPERAELLRKIGG